MNWPSLPHLIYIPFVLGVGFTLGWTLGTRAIRGEWQRSEKRRKQREEEG